MEQIIKIISIKHLTHDVLEIKAEKPKDLEYVSGQAADISINKPGLEKELRAFTFTSLPEDDYIEFVIKTYPNHNGVTNALLSLKTGDELIFHGIFGDIAYKGAGLFIAGGAGITPFLSIIRNLEKTKRTNEAKLLFANKSKGDIIHEEYFKNLLGSNFINVLSDEKIDGYEHGFVSQELIQKHNDGLSGYFYLCGPPPMMNAVEKHLASLGISEDKIVKEGF